jgi:hypothetical protein
VCGTFSKDGPEKSENQVVEVDPGKWMFTFARRTGDIGK